MSEKLDLDLRCHNCHRHAYHDCFQGEYSEAGYTCPICLRKINEEIARKLRDEVDKA